MKCEMSEGKITVTVRLIRSFEHRNIKHIVYQDVDPTTRVKDFKIYLERGEGFEDNFCLCYFNGQFYNSAVEIL